jgi:hypothetical protein
VGSHEVVCWKCSGRGHLNRDLLIPRVQVNRETSKASAVKHSARVRAPKKTLPRLGISPVRTAGNNPCSFYDQRLLFTSDLVFRFLLLVRQTRCVSAHSKLRLGVLGRGR